MEMAKHGFASLGNKTSGSAHPSRVLPMPQAQEGDKHTLDVCVLPEHLSPALQCLPGQLVSAPAFIQGSTMENEQCCADAVWEKLFVLYSKHPALPAEIHLLLPEVIFIPILFQDDAQHLLAFFLKVRTSILFHTQGLNE